MKRAVIADWILPVNQPPIANGAIVVDEAQRIIYAGPRANMPDCDVIEEYKGQAILPGLINAHTHLEFSDLHQPLGEAGMEFTRWISEVVAYRIKHGVDKAGAIKAGIEESIKSGVAAIGEIASQPVEVSVYAESSECFLNVFQEALGAKMSDYDETILQLKKNTGLLQALEVAPGISPHAPYSVPPALLERLIALAEKKQMPVAMHIAETIAEREFVEHRRGPFLEMLKEFGVWRPEMYPAEGSILQIIQSLSRAVRSLVIHGNYLNEAELDFIATVKDKMSIVFCPRTHHYFRHTEYPLDQILNRSINLAIGTDSRASNPDLNLMSELKEIHQRFPNLSPEMILKMGTINGATALGVADRLGTLEKGRAGRFCFVKLTNANDPYSWLS